MNISGKTIRISIITVAILVITFLHYTTHQGDALLHLLYRELYFIPIIMAGFFFGLRGGIIASGFVTLMYFPYILSHLDGFSIHDVGNLLQIVLFIGIGALTGWLHDRETALAISRREAESLAAMGKGVSFIAHDMRTPLIAIGGFVRQIKRKIDNDELINKLDYITEQVHRLETLINDMLSFARPLELDLQTGNISLLINEVVTITKENAVQHDVMIKQILEGDIPPAAYDHQRLHQALVNLVNNAIEACPCGSEVTLRCKNQGKSIVIEITDQGCGIPSELLDEIFIPFVTTKKQGTGLGLPIVKKIIEAHHGSIELIQNAGNGVTFRITIPVETGKIND